MYTVIIDTNILINAAYDDFSYPWKVIDLVIQGKIKAVASEMILKENRFLIQKNIKKETDKQKLEDFLVRVAVVPVHRPVRVVLDDPEDDKFIACALETKADYIISSDAHLLFLEKYGQTKILDPKDFWYEYNGQSKGEDEKWKDIFKNMFNF